MAPAKVRRASADEQARLLYLSETTVGQCASRCILYVVTISTTKENDNVTASQLVHKLWSVWFANAARRRPAALHPAPTLRRAALRRPTTAPMTIDPERLLNDHGCGHQGALITADMNVGHHGIDIGATALGLDLVDLHVGLDLGCHDWCHA